jgi:hypothetical protein
MPAVAARVRRARHLLLRRARPAARAARSTVARARTAVPEPVRKRLYPVLPWRPWRVRVALDRIQLGVMGPQSAAEFAAATGDLLWPSTLLVDGPHVDLLRRFAGVDPQDATDDELLATPYADMARACLRLHGRFFWAQDEGGIAEVARDFLARAAGAPAREQRAHQSRPGTPVLLAPIRWSDQYQVVDGHHRLAIAAVGGEQHVDAKVKWLPVTTPLQDTLNRMTWIGGERELYQPIDAPELRREWRVVRRCTDRLDKVRSTLPDGTPPGSSLDVACFFGWFVRQLGDAGFDAEGVEQDPLNVPVAEAVYGLDPRRIHVGEASAFLAGAAGEGRRWDVVTCFSLWHHFVLGRGPVDGDELLRRLDAVTGRVLYVDTGQEDEAWFAESLRGWNPASIRRRLLEVTTFDEVEDLGPDADRVPPYERNYGRHLFRCSRSAKS